MTGGTATSTPLPHEGTAAQYRWQYIRMGLQRTRPSQTVATFICSSPSSLTRVGRPTRQVETLHAARHQPTTCSTLQAVHNRQYRSDNDKSVGRTLYARHVSRDRFSGQQICQNSPRPTQSLITCGASLPLKYSEARTACVSWSCSGTVASSTHKAVLQSVYHNEQCAGSTSPLKSLSHIPSAGQQDISETGYGAN